MKYIVLGVLLLLIPSAHAIRKLSPSEIEQRRREADPLKNLKEKMSPSVLYNVGASPYAAVAMDNCLRVDITTVDKILPQQIVIPDKKINIKNIYFSEQLDQNPDGKRYLLSIAEVNAREIWYLASLSEVDYIELSRTSRCKERKKP